MGKTELSIKGEDFYINGRKTYEEVEGSKPSSHGLLMNARFIQGIFDDAAGRQRYARFGHDHYDPDEQTDNLIAALPQWYSYGLRAFTVGFQGGGPCFTIKNSTIDNNPFGDDGSTIDPAYLSRMDRLIRAADDLGMVAIVSYFYGDQARGIKDDDSVRRAVVSASRFLKEGGYKNIIIEIANEMDLREYEAHPVIRTPEGMVELIELARKESGGLSVGCSGSGGYRDEQVAGASDVIIIHGNGQTRHGYYRMIEDVRRWAPGKPVLCNEDSQSIGQLAVAEKSRTSWGYYNNLTKQEPPTDWSVLKGEDLFFAIRMAQMIGIDVEVPAEEDQYYLAGFEPHMESEGKRWIRLASLYPETIDYVDFYRNGELFYTAFDEPFLVKQLWNWLQEGIEVSSDERWTAEIHLRNGQIKSFSS